MNEGSHGALAGEDEFGASASSVGAFPADEVSSVDSGDLSQTLSC